MTYPLPLHPYAANLLWLLEHYLSVTSDVIENIPEHPNGHKGKNSPEPELGIGVAGILGV